MPNICDSSNNSFNRHVIAKIWTKQGQINNMIAETDNKQYLFYLMDINPKPRNEIDWKPDLSSVQKAITSFYRRIFPMKEDKKKIEADVTN